jgi:hypothetical protein
MRRATPAVLAGLLIALTAPTLARADTNITLSGELLTGFVTPLSGSAQVNCSTPDSGSATYSVFGTAEGPYPGTFSETGTLTWDAFLIDTFTASFTIDAPGAHIEGTKHLEGIRSTACIEAAPELSPVVQRLDATAVARYDATITTDTGTFSDHGSAPVVLQLDVLASGAATGFVQEPFLSDRERGHIELSPMEAVNTVGTTHTVTAVVQDPQLQPVAGAKVLLTVEGSVSDTGSCVTGPAGTCDFTYLGPDFPGADLITACWDFDEDGTADPGERCGTATKAWEFPTSTPGQASGGGYISVLAGRVVFGFGAQANVSGPTGGCHVIDQGAGVDIRCLSVSLLLIAGTHATFSGEAMVNGIARNYTIDVDDFGNPGALQDTFKITTDNGYVAAGVLTDGNIRVGG